MLGTETRLPDNLLVSQPPSNVAKEDKYVLDLKEHLQVIEEQLRQHQYQIRTEQSEESPAYTVGVAHCSASSFILSISRPIIIHFHCP